MVRLAPLSVNSFRHLAGREAAPAAPLPQARRCEKKGRRFREAAPFPLRRRVYRGKLDIIDVVCNVANSRHLGS